MASLLVLSFLLVTASTSPTRSPEAGHVPLKRSNPTVGDLSGLPNFHVAIQQIRDAGLDACTMASQRPCKQGTSDIPSPYVNTTKASADDDVFKKYFPSDNGVATNVKKIFQNVIGSDTSSGNQFRDPRQAQNPCADILAQIHIVPDFLDPDPDPEKNGKLACTETAEERTVAQLRNGDEDSDADGIDPKLILCPAAFEHGGFRHSYDTGFDTVGPTAVTCDTLDDRAAFKMDLLGSIFLHEYMHWVGLTIPPLGQDMSDNIDEIDVYGPIQAQDLLITDPGRTETFPDSYAWFATEAFWTGECGRSFGPARPGDDKDPHCGNNTCIDGGSSPTKGSAKLF